MRQSAFCLAVALLLVRPPSAQCQLPTTTLDYVYPAAVQLGAASEIHIAGRDLDEVDQLIFSHPGIRATPVTPPDAPPWLPHHDRFQVEVQPDVPAGRYELRAVGRYGVSNPRSLYVTSAAVAVEPSEAHVRPEQAAQLPLDTHMFGRCDGAQIKWYTFRAPSDGPMTVRCDAAPFGSPVRPVLIILDEQRREIDRIFHPQSAVTTFSVQKQSQYWIGVHDQVFRGGGDLIYCLYATPNPRVVAAFPPVMAADASQCPKLLVETKTDGGHLERHWMELALECSPPNGNLQPLSGNVVSFGSFGLPLAQDDASPGLTPLIIGQTELPVVTERQEWLRSAEEISKGDLPPQKISVPCEVAGMFYPHADSDAYEFTAEKGEILSIDVLSHRLGCPTHPRLVIQRVEGEGPEAKLHQVAVVDESALEGIDARRLPIDPRPHDPRYRLEVPESGNYRVAIRDLYSEARDDPSLTYRLQIRRPQPDFALLAWLHETDPQNGQRIAVRAPALRNGQSLILTVVADRIDGMGSPVELHVDGLPEHLHCPPVVLAPGSKMANLVITAREANQPWSGPIRIVGRAEMDGKDIERQASFATILENTENINDSRPAARLCTDLIVSVMTCEPMPLEVQLGADPASAEPLVGEPGQELEIPVQLTRREGFSGPVELSVHGLPAGARADNIQIPQDQSQATIKVKWENAELAPGPYTIYLEGKTTGKYARNQDAVAQLKERKEKFQATLEGLRSEAEGNAEAAERLKQAESLAQQIDAQLKSVEEQNKTVDLPVFLVSNSVRVLAPKAPGKDSSP